jgi:hypothetical protein
MSPRACLLAIINACHRLTEECQVCVCVCVSLCGCVWVHVDRIDRDSLFLA